MPIFWQVEIEINDFKGFIERLYTRDQSYSASKLSGLFLFLKYAFTMILIFFPQI